ncbi:hypothetical protein M9H77_21861 [Catharanthus roseus]|uniref:Uncharacterized protein n=1 Tax=Catharanthus roseus TaxID=4058 RepID=A0ACC0ARG3_CATRO|nr:hypothetical protein M9H77_21861 [Catharanthus roseus]
MPSEGISAFHLFSLKLKSIKLQVSNINSSQAHLVASPFFVSAFQPSGSLSLFCSSFLLFMSCSFCHFFGAKLNV